MDPILAVDFGTTSVRAALRRGSLPDAVVNRHGSAATPALVAVTDDGQRLVGEDALAIREKAAERVVWGMKQLVGQNFAAQPVPALRDEVAFTLGRGTDGTAAVQVGDRAIPPVELAAALLARLRQDAEAASGAGINSLLLAVPSYFSEARRTALKDAAALAGLNSVRMVNESTAACALLDTDRLWGSEERRVVVFHMGGYTCDVSVLDITFNTPGGEGITALTQDMDSAYDLGGNAIDRLVRDHLAAEFTSRTGHDPRPDAHAMLRLQDAAERAKRELSDHTDTTVELSALVAGQDLKTTLTRSTLETLAAPIIQRAIDLCTSTLTSDGRPLAEAIAQVHAVVTTGDQTRMPAVLARLTERFGHDRLRASVDPGATVALGAAYLANPGDFGDDELLLLDTE